MRDLRRSAFLAVLLLSGCGSAPRVVIEPPDPSSSAGAEPVAESAPDTCVDENGLVLEAPEIEHAWHGSYEQAGEADLTIRWCGPGELHLGEAVLTWPDGGSQTFERDVVLTRGASLTLRLLGSRELAVGTLEVRGEHEGERVLGTTSVRSVANRARTAAMSECAARGGDFGPRGMAGLEQCDVPTSDAGRPCRSSAECESYCAADGWVVVEQTSCSPGEERVELRGHCFERSLRFGCHSWVDEASSECRAVGSLSRRSVTCTD